MTKTYHVNFADRMEAAVITTLLHAGVKLGTTSLLTVRGRKSGQPHTVPVLLVEQDGKRWLVAPYGVVQWVRNIRVAGTATLTRGRHSETTKRQWTTVGTREDLGLRSSSCARWQGVDALCSLTQFQGLHCLARRHRS